MVARRYAKRRDENEPEIVAEFLRLGCTVDRLDPPTPDLLVGLPNGRLVLVEVKDPDPSKRYGRREHGNLTASQREWRLKWAGRKDALHVVESVIEVRGLVYEKGGTK